MTDACVCPPYSSTRDQWVTVMREFCGRSYLPREEAEEIYRRRYVSTALGTCSALHEPCDIVRAFLANPQASRFFRDYHSHLGDPPDVYCGKYPVKDLNEGEGFVFHCLRHHERSGKIRAIFDGLLP